MEKIIKINGMMCGHCEKKVNDALSKISTVKTVSHNNGEAIIENPSVNDEIIKKTIEDLDFEVTEILTK